MSKLQEWREILKMIIKVPKEKQHIASLVHVNPLTITRWSTAESQPRPENLLSLVNAIPEEYSSAFLESISQEYPEISKNALSHAPLSSEIPSEFYARALSSYTDSPAALYPQSFLDLVFQQSIEHLDPARQGMSISIVLCVPPREGRLVHSLRQVAGIGTDPWNRDLNQQTIFLGSESLAGSAVSNLRLVFVSSRHELFQRFSVHWVFKEQSAVACPIMRKAKIAGCLLVESAIENYFLPAHIALIERYAQLISLAFEPEQFFDVQDIQLAILPDHTDQQRVLLHARTRITHKLSSSIKNGHLLTYHQAAELVWQEIEAEFIHLS